MNKVNGFGTYQTNYYDNAITNRKEQARTGKTGSSRAGSARKADGDPVQLSERAKALLQELKRTYSNMDFMVADYESEEEAASYLARGTKDYSVLIDPEELERMAADDSVKEQNLSLLDDAVGKLDLTIKAAREPKVVALPDDKEYRAEAATASKKKRSSAGDEFLGAKADSALSRIRAVNE